MAIAAMLDTVHDHDGFPLFLIKGGVAMELRFDIAARATKDLDLAYRAGRGQMLDHLDQALRAGHGQFTARRTDAETFAEGRLNDRYRDIIDIVLLWGLVSPAGRPAVRDACEAIFEPSSTSLAPGPPGA